MKSEESMEGKGFFEKDNYKAGRVIVGRGKNTRND